MEIVVGRRTVVDIYRVDEVEAKCPAAPPT
jgi:hypothetical protein